MTRTPSTTVERAPRYDHLAALTDGRGVFEHAERDSPRIEHGYCVDDVARALLIVAREPDQTPELRELAQTYLSFLGDAIGPDGLLRNRLSVDGVWSAATGVGDWWGRALWGLGASGQPSLFRRLGDQRSPDIRAMAFATLGAGELVLAGHELARPLLIDAVAAIPSRPGIDWAWPEPRLRYANGSLAEAITIAGQALDDPALVFGGLDMLEALLAIETRSGHLSVTGTSGRGAGERHPQFDQQPIEVAAIADAAARAYDITAESRWLDAVGLAWRWFLGDNDAGIPMVDLATGAGYDGLERDGRNENRGAESTLAALGTWQQARRLELLDYRP